MKFRKEQLKTNGVVETVEENSVKDPSFSNWVKRHFITPTRL